MGTVFQDSGGQFSWGERIGSICYGLLEWCKKGNTKSADQLMILRFYILELLSNPLLNI